MMAGRRAPMKKVVPMIHVPAVRAAVEFNQGGQIL